jgi:hypothetical protein
MDQFLMNLALLATVLGLTLVCMRDRVGGWVVIVGVTLATTLVCIVLPVDLSVFTWIKLYTLAASSLWLHAMRHHAWIPWRVASWGLWAVLALNILEAVVMDALVGLWANALCGAVLIGSLVSYRRMTLTGETRHVSWPLPVTWIVAYTAWNLTFVAGKYGWHLSDHLIVLGIPLAWVLIRPDRWLEVRAYSLTLYVMVLIACVEALRTPWPVNYLSGEVTSSAPPHDALRAALTAVTCALVLFHVADRMRASWARAPAPTG